MSMVRPPSSLRAMPYPDGRKTEPSESYESTTKSTGMCFVCPTCGDGVTLPEQPRYMAPQSPAGCLWHHPRREVGEEVGGAATASPAYHEVLRALARRLLVYL